MFKNILYIQKRNTSWEAAPPVYIFTETTFPLIT